MQGEESPWGIAIADVEKGVREALQTGVLVSDTLMFERWGPDSSDSQLGHFYGLALPLLMRGLPVEPVQIETAELNRYKTLLLSYEGQKPPKPEFHDALGRAGFEVLEAHDTFLSDLSHLAWCRAR